MKSHTEKHFSFSPADIIKLVIAEIEKTSGIVVQAKDVKINVRDSRGGGYGDEYEPARLEDVTVVAKL